MGRRKKTKILKQKPKPKKLSTVFDCPFCSNSNCIRV